MSIEARARVSLFALPVHHNWRAKTTCQTVRHVATGELPHPWTAVSRDVSKCVLPSCSPTAWLAAEHESRQTGWAMSWHRLSCRRYPLKSVEPIYAGEPALDEVHSDFQAKPFPISEPSSSRLTSHSGSAKVEGARASLLCQVSERTRFAPVAAAGHATPPAT